MSELATLPIDPQAWIEGVRDAYTGLPSRAAAAVGNDRAYAAGRPPARYRQLLTADYFAEAALSREALARQQARARPEVVEVAASAEQQMSCFLETTTRPASSAQ